MTAKKSAGSPAGKKPPAAGKTAAGKVSAPEAGKTPAQAASTVDPVVTNGKPPTGGESTSTAATGAGAGDPSVKFLLGADILPALILIGGVEVQLGTVVAAAHLASGLTVEAWNALDPVERDKLLAAQVEQMEATAAAVAEAAATAAAEADAAAKAETADVEAKSRKKAVDAEDKPKRGRGHDSERESERQRIEAMFPMALTLRNNSTIPVVEPETHAYMSSGGSAPVTVQSLASLHAVRQNLDALATANYFDPEKLVIDGLPTL